MFAAFLCAPLLLLLFDAKAVAFTSVDYQQGPLSLRTLKMVEDLHIDHSSFPAECFPEERNSTNLRRRRSFSSPAATNATHVTFVNLTEGAESNFTSLNHSGYIDLSHLVNLTEGAESNFTSLNHSGYIDLSHLSEGFLSCMLWIIEEECYRILPNLSAYVPFYKRLFGYSEYIVINGELALCPDKYVEEPSQKFTTALRIVTNVGLGISIICIILHMIMFVLVDALRNLPGYCLISLCVSLVIGYITFLVINITYEEDDCSHIGMIMYYFFESSFFWMNILSYDVWRSLRMATSKLRLNSNIWFRFGVYSAYCWGTPGLIMIFGVIIDELGDVAKDARFSFLPQTCWFAFKKALLLYFILPFFILFSLNCIFFIWSFILITSASMKSAENRNVLWSRLCIFLRLAVIMGLGWIFGIIATASQENALWYFFVLFNTTQGVLIFFSFSFGQKTRKAWQSRIQKRNNSLTATQYTSSSHSQHVTQI